MGKRPALHEPWRKKQRQPIPPHSFGKNQEEKGKHINGESHDGVKKKAGLIWKRRKVKKLGGKKNDHTKTYRDL